MKLAYIRWADALAVEGDTEVPTARLAILEEVGFLLHETSEAILIGMEAPSETMGRWRLNIPRNQILEMKVKDLSKIWPKARKKKESLPHPTSPSPI